MSAIDKSRGGIGEPAVHAESVTPSDADELVAVTRGLWIGGAGNVKVKMFAGDTVTISGVQAGTLLPIRVSQVYSTDTTATLMVGLY